MPPMRFRHDIFFVLFTVLIPVTDSLRAQPADSEQVFSERIQPLLAQHCGQCHSQKIQRGQLNLATLADLLKGGESGEDLLNKGDEHGLLSEVIESGAMPPEDAPPLPDTARRQIQDWLSSADPDTLRETHSPATVTEHDVFPILLLRCKTCHGPQRQQGSVDLSSPAALLKPGPNGPSVIPGNPSASPVIQRIESEACPPRDQLLKFFVRRPSASEVQKLRDWIAAGCQLSATSQPASSAQQETLVTEQDRQHWAFQPLRGDPLEGSLDHFILARLNEADLSLSAPAERVVLVRRAFLDLTGLPPQPDELQYWLTREAPNWYASLIDTLLESPHYGERWGRFWLDLAGYADSEGGISADPIRTVAWKYRDYVIQSFNADTPYDRFLTEQLAGDELIDALHADTVTPEMVRNLTATGFLRMGIDQTGSRTMNFVPERLGVINDALTVVGSGLMGLTIECARCHSHKYDPVPQRDYYRLKAVFQGALDEHDWLTFRNRKLELATPDQLAQIKSVNPPIQKQIRDLTKQLTVARQELFLTMLRQHYPAQPDADRQLTLAALKIADNTRTLPQRLLVEKLQKAQAIPEDQQPQPVQAVQLSIDHLQDQIHSLERRLVPDATIRALWDQGRPSPTYLLRRGEHTLPGELVQPGVPAVLAHAMPPYEASPPFSGESSSTGRRLAFARWLTHPDHPLTARVMVNRLWQHHFGKGLVRSTENFGVMGDRPSHPDLLDWLALRFIREGWSIKQMHRLIMNSATYQQSSRVTDQQLQKDPENRLLSRMPLRRLDAETLRDSLLSVAGRLHLRRGGPPDPVRVRANGQVTVLPQDDGNWRRSIYAQLRRTEIPTMFATFDYPVMGPNCLERNVSTVAQQPLLLNNSAAVREFAENLADRVLQSAGDSPDQQVQVTALTALSRPPSAAELETGIQALQELRLLCNGNQRQALQTYCHAILNSAAFMFVD